MKLIISTIVLLVTIGVFVLLFRYGEVTLDLLDEFTDNDRQKWAVKAFTVVIIYLLFLVGYILFLESSC